jgi:hypothetical protein
LTQVQFKPDDGSEAMALLSQVRLKAATNGAMVPLRISFGQTLALVRSLWWMVAVGEGILAADQVRGWQRWLELLKKT